MTRSLSIVLLIILYCSSTQAEVYKWTDAEGNIHYSDTKPEDKTLRVEDFGISPIQIGDDGGVASTGEDQVISSPPPPDTSPAEVPKVKVRYEIPLLGDITPIIDKIKALFGQATEMGKEGTELLMEKTDSLGGPTITNENMDMILEQIEKEKATDGSVASGVEGKSSTPQVEIFTTPWCGYCKKATAFLSMRGVRYKERNVASSKVQALRQKKLGGGNGVPFAVINGKKIRGWNKRAYDQALALED
jgi:glutaredoxin 3